MKLLCSISGIPYRSNDALPFSIIAPHPIFSLDFQQLTSTLDYIKDQEEKTIAILAKAKPSDKEGEAALFDILDGTALSKMASDAIKGKEFKDPAFQYYQTKKLIMLAWLKQGNLLKIENGYYARPRPEIIDLYFWQAVELATWAANLRTEIITKHVPIYAIGPNTSNMGNFGEYLETLEYARIETRQRIRSVIDEVKLERYEQTIAIIAQRRNIDGIPEWKGNNNLIANWALKITSTPASIYEFWHGILTLPAITLRYNGVRDPLTKRAQIVTLKDIEELHDWLKERLLQKEDGSEDGSYYYTAARLALAIVKNHEAQFRADQNPFEILNNVINSPIIDQSDAGLNEIAIQEGIEGQPVFNDFGTKLDYYIAMSKWRMMVKRYLTDKLEKAKAEEEKKKKDNDGGNNYDIL